MSAEGDSKQEASRLGMAAILVAILTAGGLLYLLVTQGAVQKTSVAIIDSNGMCWVAEEGQMTRTGADIAFHHPAVVLEHAATLKEDQLKRILQTELRHCVQLKRK